MTTELNVKAITKLTGLNEHTLRAWERRYQAVSPRRSGNGRRIYTTDDVERLRLLVQLQERGYAIGQIASQVNSELKEILSRSEEFEVMHHRGGLSHQLNGEILSTIARIEKALHAYDLHSIHLELNRARNRFGAKVFAIDVVAPLMSIVGKLVTADKMTIAQEHALSAVIKCHLGALLYDMHQVRAKESLSFGPNFAITTMEGDMHDIGILASAVMCAFHGVSAFYLGPSMPAKALNDAVRALGVTHILIGKAKLPPGCLVSSPEVFLNELVNLLPANVDIWLGGCFDLDFNQLTKHSSFKLVRTLTELDQHIEGMNI